MNTEQQKFMKMKIDINIHVKYTRNSLGFFCLRLSRGMLQLDKNNFTKNILGRPAI